MLWENKGRKGYRTEKKVLEEEEVEGRKEIEGREIEGENNSLKFGFWNGEDKGKE